MAISASTTLLMTVGLILLLANPAHAFGAGNIASLSTVEGTNWRHGDIEDTLLTLFMSRAAGGKKFDKMMVARVYFGNWLRDYCTSIYIYIHAALQARSVSQPSRSIREKLLHIAKIHPAAAQAIDVGTVKYVSAEAIRILLWVLGFMTFGYGTKEFEVTAERLGCYRPEDHIDNPKDYADNLDAREYDPRLRGPVNERVELAVDERRGLKNYIASEERGITTSAGHVRSLFTESIRLGRSYARSGNKAELYEALRLLGTGCHCLEDFSAHSNYTELALIELGQTDVFPHVGRRTQMRLPGAQHHVYPLITGTFGGVDFLHSMMGEFDDKATQSELDQLAGAMQDGSQGDTSMLKTLMDKLPSGLLGSKDQASKADQLQANSAAAQMQNMHVSPKEPESFTVMMQEMVREVYPIMEWHDEIMQDITETIEKIPVLPALIEQLEDQINIFVFSLLAPFIVPLIGQLKTELNEGSSEVIQSSMDKQHIVFNDDYSSDPTHSMLSKDHFSNVLNEPAGKIAGAVLKWAVPQVIAAWDDERIDPNRTCSRIINGVLHHPAQRNMGEDGAIDGRRIMFGVVQQWWEQKQSYEQDELRTQLSRDGVSNGLNHKPGEHDTGHGSCKPLGIAKHSEGCGAGGILSDLLSALGGGATATGAGSGYGRPTEQSSQIGRFAEQAVGGGALGGVVGALTGGIGGSLLGEVFGNDEKKTYTQEYASRDGGVTESYTELGRARDEHGQPEYGQAQYQQTRYPDGRQRTEFAEYEQQGSGRGSGGYGYEESYEERPVRGGYEENVDRTYREPGGETERYQEEGFRRDEFEAPPGPPPPSRRYEEAEYRRQEPAYEEGQSFGGRYGGAEPEYRRQEPVYEQRERFGGGYVEESGGRGEYERENRGGYGGGGGGGESYEPEREREREREEYREEEYVAEERREEEEEEEYREEKYEGRRW
ncbi:MAG: hypothetical protein M1818_002815 [Claussenomyces sp. TS43310]|nr:MAG: hypothetical protein M1818_002815 [Claussenomyces sp. TS43310]